MGDDVAASGRSNRRLPTGPVTFVFTDIEGSTRLLSRLGDEYQGVLESHDALLRAAIADNGGTEVNTEGDAFFAVFTAPGDALAAAARVQVDLLRHPWPEAHPVRVRIGVHSGEGRLGGDDYIGLDVHLAARIASVANGGQVLVSEATASLVADLPSAAELRDLGAYVLKDFDEPMIIYQLVAPGLPGELPPPRARRPGNVPEPPTEFIGRQQDITALTAILEDARLVTITGPGGAGKTRLALRVAAELTGAVRDGVYFVPLEHLREPDLVTTAVATALDLHIEDEPVPTLLDRLEGKQVLLVLDNFEQVVDAAGDMASLIAGAPDLTILATSQVRLGIYGEREYPVPPLTTPDPADPPAVERLLDFEAVSLFDKRARAAKPTFGIDATNAQPLTQLVARLEGQPLAIELAAARIRLLSPQAILDRIEQRLDLLSTSARDVPERQRTLRTAIDWSYGLLKPPEQHVFDRLGIFAGWFGIEDAETIVGGADECGVESLDALGSLVDKSLLRQAEVDGEPRFSQLESIRDYALERLAERGESDLVHTRLANHVAKIVEAAERYLDRADDEGWFARLDREQDNLREVLRWAIGRRDGGLAERIVGPVWRYWLRKGLLAEGTWWTDAVLELGTEPTTGRAASLIAQGSLAYWRGDLDAAGTAYRAALRLYEQLGDVKGSTDASYNLGYAQAYGRPPDREGALASFSRALEGYRLAEEEAMVQSTLVTLGILHAAMDELEAARELLEESLAIGGGDVRPRSTLASLAIRRGDHREARRQLTLLAQETESVPDLGFGIVQLEHWAALEAAHGDAERAMLLLGAAHKLREDIGGGPPRDPVLDFDPDERARARLGEEAADAALVAGRALDADAAMSLALGRSGAAPRTEA